MIKEDTRRFFFWGDDDGITGVDNETVKGFIAALNGAFFDSSASHQSMYDRLGQIAFYTAIKYDLLNETTMDMLADQMRLPGWKYIKKYNLASPWSVRDLKSFVLQRTHELMRYRGTPFAVVRILETLQYTLVYITENIEIDIKYDGTFHYDGTARYMGTFKHQLFTVELTSDVDIIGAGTPTTPDDPKHLQAIIDVINYYKKERVELYQLIIHDPTNPAGVTVQVWSA